MRRLAWIYNRCSLQRGQEIKRGGLQCAALFDPAGLCRRRQSAQRPKREAWKEIIEQILEQDQAVSNKRHHSGSLSGDKRSTDSGAATPL